MNEEQKRYYTQGHFDGWCDALRKVAEAVEDTKERTERHLAIWEKRGNRQDNVDALERDLEVHDMVLASVRALLPKVHA